MEISQCGRHKTWSRQNEVLHSLTRGSHLSIKGEGPETLAGAAADVRGGGGEDEGGAGGGGMDQAPPAALPGVESEAACQQTFAAPVTRLSGDGSRCNTRFPSR